MRKVTLTRPTLIQGVLRKPIEGEIEVSADDYARLEKFGVIAKPEAPKPPTTPAAPNSTPNPAPASKPAS